MILKISMIFVVFLNGGAPKNTPQNLPKNTPQKSLSSTGRIFVATHPFAKFLVPIVASST